MKHGRLESVQQAIINPCESASFNLLTAVGNAGALNVMKVLMPADDAMDAVSNAVNSESNPEKLEAIYQDLQASADEAAHDVALAEEAAFAQEATTSNSALLASTVPVSVFAPFWPIASADQLGRELVDSCLTCITCSCRQSTWKSYTLTCQIKSENCVSSENTCAGIASWYTTSCAAHSVNSVVGNETLLTSRH